MIKIPYDCPRGRKDCIALATLMSDDKSSFFCCGENNGENIYVKQDRYTVCFKGKYRDDTSYHDKRDLTHNSAVINQALAVITADTPEDSDWSPWKDL